MTVTSTILPSTRSSESVIENANTALNPTVVLLRFTPAG
jgi:hypothetical protein